MAAVKRFSNGWTLLKEWPDGVEVIKSIWM